MNDFDIIKLYNERSEMAISATAAKYSKYCLYIANNILRNNGDAEECVNDTYLRAWRAIPPAQPVKLSAFLGKITRNLSLNRLEKLHAKKRNLGTRTPALPNCRNVSPAPRRRSNKPRNLN